MAVEADDDLSYSFTFDIVDDLSDLPFEALAVYEEEDGTDYSFASGAVDDIVLADDPVQMLDWWQEQDDDSSYSFAYGPADEIILDEPALASLEYAAEYDDETNYSFASDIGGVVALDEPINNDLPFAYFDYGDDEQDYSFTFGPLADDAIVPIVIGGGGNDVRHILADRKRRRLIDEASLARSTKNIIEAIRGDAPPAASRNADDIVSVAPQTLITQLLPVLVDITPMVDVLAEQQSSDDDMIMALLLSI